MNSLTSSTSSANVYLSDLFTAQLSTQPTENEDIQYVVNLRDDNISFTIRVNGLLQTKRKFGALIPKQVKLINKPFIKVARNIRSTNFTAYENKIKSIIFNNVNNLSTYKMPFELFA